MTTKPPLPFEIKLASDLVLRGLEYSNNGPAVVLLHDLGGDADSWRAIPSNLVDRGFRVINLELRGHGLSDGEVDTGQNASDIEEALGIISGSFGPVGLVGVGSSATTAFGIGEEQGSPVHILVSPLPNPEVDLDRSIPAMRGIFSGKDDLESDEFVRSHYQTLRGQNMWFSTGADKHGVELLEANPTMIDQIATFLRRYLIGHHLAWIAEHQADGTAGESSGEADQPRPAAGQ